MSGLSLIHIWQLLADYLNRHGYDTLLAPDASDLPSRITRYAPDLLVLCLLYTSRCV